MSFPLRAHRHFFARVIGLLTLCVAARVEAQIQSPPRIASAITLRAYDGYYAQVDGTADTPALVNVIWRVQVGTKSYPIASGAYSPNLALVIATPGTVLSSPSGYAALVSPTSSRALAAIGPFTMADNGLPVTIFASNAFGTTSRPLGSLLVLGLVPTFVTNPTTKPKSGFGFFFPPTITGESESLGIGSDATLFGSAFGSPILTFQWKKDGDAIPGATGTNLKLTNIGKSDAGIYHLSVTNTYGTTTSPPLTILTIVAPVIITQQPQSLTAGQGGSVALSVTVSGTPPLTYQWRKNGNDIAGATQATLAFPNVTAADAGGYQVSVRNSLGAVTSNSATLTVGAPVVVFTVQPRDAIVNAGAAFTLQASASGTGTITYQWRKADAAIPGATDASFTVTQTQLADAGTYTVVASTTAGFAISDPATVTVNLPPTIVQQPEGRRLLLGSELTLAAVASGTPPLRYRWQKDGADIFAATGSTLALSSLAVADAGAYTVIVTNAAGSATSADAMVEVDLPGMLINLSILTSLQSAGESFSIGAVVGGNGTIGTKQLLFRAVGPSLAQFGVGSPLPDPQLELFNTSGAKTAENDDWAGAVAISSAGAQVGAFGFAAASSKDAALYSPAMTLGGSSVKISGVGSATGTVLAEVYDASRRASWSPTTPRLINLSVLKPIGNGLTAGFVVAGTTSTTVLVRAIGPSLSAFGVTDFVPDTKLELFASGATMATNDNWGGGSELTAAFGKVAAFELAPASKDAALLATLPPGSYTVQATPATASTGVTLLEIYEVP